MMKIYDTEHQFLDFFTDGLRNVYTTEILETGTKSLCFQIPCLEKYLSLVREEHYIETQDYEYVVKELVLEKNDFFTVYCSANIEELSGTTFSVFDCFEKNPEQAYTYCLQPVPTWSIDYQSQITTVLTLQTSNVSALEMIRTIADMNHQELWFDAKNKVLRIYDRIGRAKSNIYYSNELKLRQLSKQSSTYDYATVLYPIGKNGLTIESVNNGKKFIENYNYSNKRIVKYWYNEDIDVPERLLGAGQDYLDSIAEPVSSLKVSLSELNADTKLGDTIMLVDNIKKLRQKKRVVKIINYPFEPERSSVEVSNRQADFARTFVKQQKVLDKEIKYIRSVIENNQ